MNVGIKSTAYCLHFVPELAFHHGGTPVQERNAGRDDGYFAALAKHAQSYDEAAGYAPNKAYIGAMTLEELAVAATPWHANTSAPVRYGNYGEIMPEDEFLGLLHMCDAFDLIWLEQDFATGVKEKLAESPVLGREQCDRLKPGHPLGEIQGEIDAKGALPLHFAGKVVGCCRRAHDSDASLDAHVVLENLACKASGVLALLHLLKNSGLDAADIDFVIECSEEAVGDALQRGGGNLAKAVAEIAGCGNASGFDVRAFCSGPTAALLTAAGMVASGIRKNVAVVAGGSVPKLYMNSREHVKKGQPALENAIGSFAVLLVPDDGQNPVLRLDAVGKHTVGAGASPQAITSALTFEPLECVGLKLTDVDKYAPELHNAEITLPAGAGNVPEANFKMIAALAVMKGQIKREEIANFVAERGLPGYVQTQGHIPSGVPYIGHACDAIRAGNIRRAMIIGKGSLFLGRMTNLADGASFLVEAPGPATPAGDVTKADIQGLLLEALSDLAAHLRANGDKGGQ